jgi:hypothetical protein
VTVVVEGLLGLGVAYHARFDPQAKGLGEWRRSRHVEIPEGFGASVTVLGSTLDPAARSGSRRPAGRARRPRRHRRRDRQGGGRRWREGDRAASRPGKLTARERISCCSTRTRRSRSWARSPVTGRRSPWGGSVVAGIGVGLRGQMPADRQRPHGQGRRGQPVVAAHRAQRLPVRPTFQTALVLAPDASSSPRSLRARVAADRDAVRAVTHGQKIVVPQD